MSTGCLRRGQIGIGLRQKTFISMQQEYHILRQIYIFPHLLLKSYNRPIRDEDSKYDKTNGRKDFFQKTLDNPQRPQYTLHRTKTEKVRNRKSIRHRFRYRESGLVQSDT